MGAWGVSAYENDTAGDWTWKHVFKPVEKLIKSKRADPDEVLLALALVVDLKLTAWFDARDLKAALDRVRENDKTTGWKDPAKRARYLAKIARGFKASPQGRWSPLMGVSAHKSVSSKPHAKKPKGAVKP